MPKELQNEKFKYPNFEWILSTRSEIFQADGRGNAINVGRHSLGTKDYAEAKKLLHRLDLKMAVKFNLIDRSELPESDQIELLSLEGGWNVYKAYISRPIELGGLAVSSQERYEDVYLAFAAFAKVSSIKAWNQVTKKALTKYVVWRKNNGSAFSTAGFETTHIKTMVNWFIEEGLLPSSSKIKLKVAKPGRSDRYCFADEEVAAMMEWCATKKKLRWLYHIIVGLSHTGLRISELCGLRWSDVDDELEAFTLKDERSHVKRSEQTPNRRMKSKKERTLPIQERLRKVLEEIPRPREGYIFRNSKGGKLRRSCVLKALIRNVIKPLADQFPTAEGEVGFADGVLHSFRHYFCSQCVHLGIPEHLVLTWLGHESSNMLRWYYDRNSKVSKAYMNKMRFGIPINHEKSA